MTEYQKQVFKGGTSWYTDERDLAQDLDKGVWGYAGKVKVLLNVKEVGFAPQMAPRPGKGNVEQREEVKQVEGHPQ